MNAIRAITVAAAFSLTGCASVANNPADPLEPVNRGIYKFNDAVDKAVVKPVAKGYSAVVPGPIKMMVTNFFSNLDDIIVTANDFLQFKVKQGLADGTRFVVNTTVGIYGLVDVGTMVGLEKHNEDFGQTLGKWGVAPGPYLVLPLLGPSTLRDSVGLYVDSRPSKLRRVNHMRTRNQLYATKAINRRSQLLDDEKVLDEAASIDRYEFVRDAYLLRRESLIYDGKPPRDVYDVPDDQENYDQVPINNMPSSQLESEPPTQSADNAIAPADAATQATPASTSSTVGADDATGNETEKSADAGRPLESQAANSEPESQPEGATVAEDNGDNPGVHKVWVSQSSND